MDQRLEGPPPPPLLSDEQLLAAAGFDEIVLLDRGPQSALYRATQPSLRRTVAIRLHHQPMPDAAARARFWRQCAVLGSLGGHPNIVEVYGCEFEAGRPYVVMELPAGGALADRLRDGDGLAWSEVVEMTVVLAGALQTAHTAGVVHGGITVDDVLVSAYGPPQLADFARFDDEPAATSPAEDVRDLARVCAAALSTVAPVPPQVLQLLQDGAEGRITTAEELGRTTQQLQRELGVPVTPLPLRPVTPGGHAAAAVSGGRQRRTVLLAGGALLAIAALVAVLLVTRSAPADDASAVLDIGTTTDQWRPDAALATQLQSAPDVYLCRDPAAATQARSVDVGAARLPTSGARVAVVLRRFPTAAARQLLGEMSGQAACLARLDGLADVTATPAVAGEQGVQLRYRRPAAESPVEIVVLMARQGGTVGQIVHLGYPAADPAVTEELRGALHAALTGGPVQ